MPSGRVVSPDVRFGSLADIRTAKSHVRFLPKSGHVRCNYACPLRAKSGHWSPSLDHLIRAGEQRCRRAEVAREHLQTAATAE
jgi:hypothetical protein